MSRTTPRKSEFSTADNEAKKKKRETRHTEGSEDLPSSKKVRQSLKVIGRTMVCFVCFSQEPARKEEPATFYCACGTLLCTFHTISHKCLVISRMEYDEELMASLA